VVTHQPELRTLVVGDEPSAWARAGFAVTGDETSIGAVGIRLAGGDRRGVVAWERSGIGDGSIDGILSIGTERPPARPVEHPNLAVRVDHVVITTPDLGRTLAALQAFGFEPRRHRDVPGAEPARRQVFLWAGEAILEVVGPIEPAGGKPASIWGLALASDNMEQTVTTLGPAVSQPRPAVQPGRTIATLDTTNLDISVSLAFMSAHVKPPRL
jgi:hypothetical protein